MWSVGLAAAEPRLKWHFLSAGFQQTALFGPLLGNRQARRTPPSKTGSLKTHGRHLNGQIPGFDLEGSWRERASRHRHTNIPHNDKWTTSTTPWRTFKEGSSKLWTQLIFHLFASVISHQPEEKDWVSLVSTSRLWWNTTSTLDRGGIWIVWLHRSLLKTVITKDYLRFL